MKRKNFVRIIAVILAILIVGSVILGAVGSLTAHAVTQKQIDELKAKKTDLNRQRQEVQSKINTLEYEQMAAVAKKEVLDDRIMLTEEEIENLDELIYTYSELIEEKKLEVVAAQSEEDKQWVLYKDRIRRMEENGVISYLDIIFRSSSFSDLLARIDIVSDIMRSDENTYQQLVTARLDTIAAQEQLELTKLEQEGEKAAREVKLLELADQREQSIELIAQIEDNRETSIEIYKELQAQEDKVQKEINEKVEELKRQEAAAAAAAAAAGRSAGGGGAVGSGSFMWPCPSSNYVTSRYGTRVHPVYGTYRTHTGVDIGGGYGANIVAADSGTVITSAYNSGYGNYVVISHGNGITTLYGHMSSRKVTEGASVSKGAVIGLVGSTGVSTGPHLHFEVSINGSRTDPLRYFSGYVLSSNA